MATLGSVVIEIAANSAQFRSEIERTRAELARLSGSPVEQTRAGLAKVKTETEGTGRSLAQMTQAARLMTGQLVTEMNPALGAVITVTANAARGFQSYSLALAGIGVGVTAAIAIITQLSRATLEAAKNQAELNIAIASFDTGTLESKLKAATVQIETFREQSKSAVGVFANMLRTIGQVLNLIPSPAEEAQKARAGIAKIAPMDTERLLAEKALKDLAARKTLNETLVSQAELANNLTLYDRAIQTLDDIIRLEQDAAALIARNEAARKIAQAEVLGISPEVLKTELQATLNTLATLAAAQREVLRQRAEAGRIGMMERTPRPGVPEPILGERFPELAERPFLLTQPIQNYIKALDEMDAMAANLGQSFDKTGAEINATTRALEEFARLGIGPADDRVQELQSRLTMLTTVREVFASVGSAVSQTIGSVIQGTQSLEQAFANMGRNIALSMIDSVINKGLKVLQEALIKFIDDLQKAGLIEALTKIGVNLLGAGAGAGTSSAAVPAGSLALQHGGIVTRPTMALVGEAGAEAVIPLTGHGMSGPMVEVNVINQAPGTTAESRERTMDGRRIHDIIIREVRQGASMGELDSMFGSFGGRRVATQR